MMNKYLSPHNAQIYESFRDKFDRFYDSEQHAIKNAVRKSDRVLDIGCNRAGLLVALKEIHGFVNYVGIDPDPACIKIARKEHLETEFIEGYFPEHVPKNKRYDSIFCLSLFTHFTDWKDKLSNMASICDRKIIVDVAMTMTGASVCDPDVSYSYYLGSGERAPYVVLNALQFTNFCFTEKVNASRVEVVATRPKSDNSMAGVAIGEMIRGVAIIDIDASGKEIFGGQQRLHNPEFVSSINKKDYREPEAIITIDGQTKQIYPKGTY